MARESGRYNDPLPKSLRKLMEEKGITQEELGKAIGKERGSINQYATGTAAPKLDTLIKIAQYFGVSTDFLLGLTPSRSVDLTDREICNRTNLTDGALEALSNLSRSGGGDSPRKDIVIMLVNEIILILCRDPDFLKNISRYWEMNQEILYTTGMYLRQQDDTGEYWPYDPSYGGALALDPDGDEMALLRFKLTRAFDWALDDITDSQTARAAAAAFKKAYPERFWKDDDGNIAGPIWYIPAKDGGGCYPAHMTFEQYRAEVGEAGAVWPLTEEEMEAGYDAVAQMYADAPAGTAPFYDPAADDGKGGTVYGILSEETE